MNRRQVFQDLGGHCLLRLVLDFGEFWNHFPMLNVVEVGLFQVLPQVLRC
jgi:hypothetical protein